MSGKFSEEAKRIMDERFGCDTVIALATTEGKQPWVRMVNAYYEEGSFYVITDTRSNKMRQMEENPLIAVCGEWFTAHGTGEKLGHIREERNKEIASRLQAVFCEWYDNGHVNEEDPNTCILRIRLRDGVLFSHGTRYDIDFGENK